MNLFGLLQLTQVSAAGGIGYYFGAQRVLGCTPVQHEEALAALVENALADAIGPAEGVASGITFRLSRAGAVAEIPAVCGWLAAQPLPPEMRQTSLQIGKQLWEVSRHWEWAGAVHEQLDPLVQAERLPHAVAFGALVSETTGSQVRAIATYLLHVARAIVGAAVRAIPLDENAGQRVLARAQERIVPLAADLADKGPADIHGCA